MSARQPLLVGVSLALVSAALIAAATRPWGLGVIAAFGYAPAFAAIASQRSAARGAALAVLAAFGSTSVGYQAAFGIAPWAYPVAAALAAAPFAVVGAVSGRLAALTPARPLLALLVLPPLWCAAEFLPAQSRLLGDFALPLSAVGYSQADLPSIHLARVSSVSAVSLALLTHNALLAGLLTARPPGSAAVSAVAAGRRARVLIVIGLACLYALTFGVWRTAPSPEGVDALTLRVVQPHITQAAHLAAEVLPASRHLLLERLLSLSATDGSETPDLTVWPEASLPGVLDVDSGGGALTPLTGSGPLLFGAMAAGPRRANIAVHWDGRTLTRVYDKQRLVPFAESGLEPARREARALVPAAGALAAPLICYDALFPALAREAARSGATLLVLLTDDAFAGASEVPEQHLRAARFRAVETGLPLVVASNMGPSAVFGPDGSELGRLPHGATGALQVVIPVSGATTRVPTAFVRFGDTLGAAASLLSLAAGAFALVGGGGGPSSRPRPT